MRAAWGLPDIAAARLILASRHGEFGRTLSILDSLAANAGVSPADFTLSVHHALIGLLSIATGNRRGHTAIAAGDASFELGFVEALACLVERPAEPVVLIFYDEGLPAPFADFDESPEPPLAMALALAPGGSDDETFGLMRASPSPSAPRRPARAVDFLRFLLTDIPRLASRDAGGEWLWRRHAAAA